MSDMRKYIKVLNESFVAEGPSYEEGVIAILQKYPGAIEALKAGEYPEDPNLMEELYDYFLESGEMPYGIAKARDGDPDEWIMDELTSIVPYEGGMGEAAVEEDSIYAGADEYKDTVHPHESGGDGDTPDEKFGDDEIYEEEDDMSEENTNEEWETQFNETLARMKQLAGVRVVAEEEDETVEEEKEEVDEASKPDFADIDGDGDKEEPMKKAAKDKEEKVDEAADEEIEEDKEEIDEGNKPDFLDMDDDGDKEEDMKDAIKDKEEKVDEAADEEIDEEDKEEVDEAAELARFLKLSGLSEDSIYPDAKHMSTEKKWDQMGSDGPHPDQKFGNDEIYGDEEGPMKHTNKTTSPGEDKTPSAPFTRKMAEAAIAGNDTFEHEGQTFKVRMNEDRAKEILG